MSDPFPIRRAVPADVPAIHRLVELAYGHHVRRIGKRPAPMGADYADVVRVGHTWVAEQAGALAGVLVLVPADDHLLIENVAVDPARWGQGVGGRLLELAEDRAREAGLPELQLYTNALMTENRSYYARRGYRETARQVEAGFDRVHSTSGCRRRQARCETLRDGDDDPRTGSVPRPWVTATSGGRGSPRPGRSRT